MLTRLNGILLGRKPKAVEAHRVQHIKAFESFITRNNVRSNVAQRVSYVQTCSRRVRKHVEDVILGFTVVNFSLVGLVFFPKLLPFFFNFAVIVFHFFSVISTSVIRYLRIDDSFNG